VILYAIIFGLDTARAVTPMAVIRALVAIGLIIYAGTGFAALVAGGNFLDYSALTRDPVEGQELGIMVIEFGVGTTVAAVMILIFYMFAGRGR
jgi:multicomponent Na+:H+ antiporter subunit B